MTPEALLLSVCMAVAAGLVGSFAVMRRMSLAADPLSHVALPGIGLALALHSQPIVGAVAALLVGAVLVWLLEERAQAATEAMIGVVFAAALAVGSLTTSGEHLIDALFGSNRTVSVPEVLFVVVASIAIVVFILICRNSLVITLISPDIARTAGVNVRRLDLLYLLAFALTIALGLRYLGVLLMGALIIIPAVTSKRIARRLGEMLWLSIIIAIVATLLGMGIAAWLKGETGPIIVLVAAAGFAISLLKRAPSGVSA
jgi:ABC-type Mn2+/Zn2+ transport system permease subunit